MSGKGVIEHNRRTYIAENVDPERTHLNIEYCYTPIEQAYHELFDEALAAYNVKQKRKDRCIENYYKKICDGDQEKPFYEVIFQIGNKDDMPAASENGKLAWAILDKFMRSFQERNPHLHVFSAHLHMDEATPHLHIDFIPFTTGSKRGLSTRVSLKQALADQGITGEGRSMTERAVWVQKEKEALAEIMLEHSAHIANTMEFAKVRYAQKSNAGVIYKNLNTFAQANSDNVDFIRKYLTLTKCDLFFADKVIFVEGASERLLLPDMIEKCETAGVFGSCKYPLSAQYYALIEIGGAYAHKFIPFIEFLGVPCLIITDLDSVADRINKDGKVVKKSVVVSEGETTSNETIKWWIRRNKGLPEDDTSKIDLTEIISLTPDNKTKGKCHIEFQTAENGLCGHSLEEAIRNVNRKHYDLGDSISEEDLEFKGKSKTDFALDLIYKCADYCVPAYIKSGLTWLNNQRVLE